MCAALFLYHGVVTTAASPAREIAPENHAA
jgi:hypothetical protein